MLIFLPAFYLIIWLIASPKNFEKIAILKIWQLVFFWGVKTYFSIFRHEKWLIVTNNDVIALEPIKRFRILFLNGYLSKTIAQPSILTFWKSFSEKVLPGNAMQLHLSCWFKNLTVQLCVHLISDVWYTRNDIILRENYIMY